VPAAGSRLREAAAMDFRSVFLPSGDAGEAARFVDLSIRPVDSVAGFLELLR
jgi:hypothetical protein